MGDFPALQIDPGFGSVISTGSPLCAVGDAIMIGQIRQITSTAWGTANLAFYYPFILPQRALATQMSHQNGTVVAGNVDVGIYDERGNKLVSKGAVAQAGTSTIQVHDITDTALQPGLYFMGISLSDATATILRGALATTAAARTLGVCQQATAHPLPTTATMAAVLTANIFDLAVHFAAGAV